MTTTPQEPQPHEQEDPQTHLQPQPDRIPDAQETVSGDNDPDAGAPERASDPGDVQEDQPGVDPSWGQQAQGPAGGRDDSDLPG